MARYVTQSELIESLFSAFSSKGKYRGDRISLHSEIAKVAEDVPALRKRFHFDKEGSFPYSAELESALAVLGTSKLSFDNPWLQVLRVKSSLKTEFSKVVRPRLTPSLRTQLLNASKKLEMRLKKRD